MRCLNLDEVIHAPIRLRICAYLASISEIEFKKIRELLDVSDSVLSKHLKVLEEAGYLDIEKRSANGRSHTWLALNADGRKAYTSHVRALRNILK